MNKSFYSFPINTNLQDIENKVNNLKLMYRRPGSETHENITQALDAIFHKLSELENRLNAIEQ